MNDHKKSPLRAPMTLLLTAVRYAKPEKDEDDFFFHGNPLFAIPETYLRPIIRCLVANQGKIPNEIFNSNECAEATAILEGKKSLPDEYRPLSKEEFPVNLKKWY